MNRAYLIAIGPVLLVAIGYVLVERALRMEPDYLKLVAAVAVLGLGFWWIVRKDPKGTPSR